MKKLNVIWVDDELDRIEFPVSLLESTGFIEVTTVSNYHELEKEPGLIDDADIFILDILIGRDTTEFVSFVESIAGKKPFITYTIRPTSTDLTLPSGSEDIRGWVLSKGGLAAIAKGSDMTPDDPRSKTQIDYDLVERVLTFYWCRSS